jgi:hypothetical protein
MVGPIIILDKSTFQSLAKREHFIVGLHFHQNLTPVLHREIWRDLSLDTESSPEQKVATLAAKFGGSGPNPCTHFTVCCINSLLGTDPPMDGSRVPLPNASPVVNASGDVGMFIDLDPENRQLLRWACGQFTDDERAQAEAERRNAPTAESIDRLFERHHVLIPRVASLAEIAPAISRLLDDSRYAEVWLAVALQIADAPPPYVRAVRERWLHQVRPFVSFAPYAAFCVSVYLAAHIAQSSGMIRRDRNNPNDVEYLLYLPFCQVFASNDNLHLELVPVLGFPRDLVGGSLLKADLKRIADFRDALSERHARWNSRGFGFRPPPWRDSPTHAAWTRYMGPWRRGGGNAASDASEEERAEMEAWIDGLIAEGE